MAHIQLYLERDTSSYNMPRDEGQDADPPSARQQIAEKKSVVQVGLVERLNAATLVHDLTTPPSACISCKLAYPVAKRLERKGIFFPCSQHFTCWYCSEYRLIQQEESGSLSAEFRCPGGADCKETITMAEAVVRIRGIRCFDCSSTSLPSGNSMPWNALGCDKCFRCERCSITASKMMLDGDGTRSPKSKWKKGRVPCPTDGCDTTIDQEKLEVLAQRRCTVCKVANKSEPRKVSYCGNNAHFVCEACINAHLAEEASKPFDEMADVIECPGGRNCVISRALVQQQIGSKCKQCRTRSKKFEMSECRTACDDCLRVWITTFTADNNNVIREVPCPVHPKREECRVGQRYIERVSGKICLVCFERKPVATGGQAMTPCDDHFVCEECMQFYCHQQMRENFNAFSFRCPGSTQCSARVYYRHIRLFVGEESFQSWQQYKIDNGMELLCPNARCRRYGRKMSVVSSVESMCDHCDRRTCLVCRERSKKGHRCKGPQDQEFLAYVKDPTNEVRPCVQCLRFIHREQGCNHMTCYGALGCGAEFCWICLKPMNSVHVRCPLLSFGDITEPPPASAVDDSSTPKSASRRSLVRFPNMAMAPVRLMFGCRSPTVFATRKSSYSAANTNDNQ